jgi:hypothetical protein
MRKCVYVLTNGPYVEAVFTSKANATRAVERLKKYPYSDVKLTKRVLDPYRVYALEG